MFFMQDNNTAQMTMSVLHLMTLSFLLHWNIRHISADEITTSLNPFLSQGHIECHSAECRHKGTLTDNYDQDETLYGYPPFAPDSDNVLGRSIELASCSRRRQPRLGNTCSGFFNNTEDTDRIPSVIAEYQCSCKFCNIPRVALAVAGLRNRLQCKPIFQLYQTLRRQRQQGEEETWVVKWEPISVGCKCVDITMS